MNRDEIILIASQCGDWDGNTCEMNDAGLEIFAEAILAAERAGRNSKSWRDIAKENLEGMAMCRYQLAELKANSQAVLQAQSEAWQREVAESQAREVKLRETLEYYSYQSIQHGTENNAAKALDLPTDDTALREVIAKAGEVMRERIVDRPWLLGDVEKSQIRAIPCVTLEDLK